MSMILTIHTMRILGGLKNSYQKYYQNVILSKANITASQIISIGITNQRETTLIWDKNTGKPMHNAIVWQDRRTASICQSLSQDESNADKHPNRPLVHMQSELQKVEDKDLKNIIILVKLCDRYDNLRQRIKSGKLRKKYKRKSEELIDWLLSQYTGKRKPISILIGKLQDLDVYANST